MTNERIQQIGRVHEVNSYIDKLKDPRWQRKRLEILQRDNWTCQGCGRTDKCLNVHHKFYEPDREPWDYEDESLITLCEDCHLLERLRVAPGDRIELVDELLNWWVVLNNPVGLPWHIEQLNQSLKRPPEKNWRIIGMFPSWQEANTACDEFERRLKIKQRGIAS